MKTFTIQELLEWWKRYEIFIEGDNIDAAEGRKEFLEFIMYLVNNHLPDDKKE